MRLVRRTRSCMAEQLLFLGYYCALEDLQRFAHLPCICISLASVSSPLVLYFGEGQGKMSTKTEPWDAGYGPADKPASLAKEANAGAASDRSSEQENAASSYGINEKKLVRKLDLHLLPGVCLLYLLSFLDRSNVANAKLEGLTTDLHITGNQYLTGLTLFFVGYILLEVLWNVILKRIGPKLWLPTITFCWGVVATLQGVVQYNGGQSGVAGFLIVRFFLGLTEGGLFPGVVFYLSMWYKREERQFRIALFFAMASLAGAFGGILAYGISFMNGVGGYKGWVSLHSSGYGRLWLIYLHSALDLYH